jgi:hypothetical protein
MKTQTKKQTKSRAAAPKQIDDELRALIDTALTDYLCQSKSDAGEHVPSLLRILGGYAVTDALAPIGDDKGEVLLPPPNPEFVLPTLKPAKPVRKKLGLSLDDLGRQYRKLRREQGVQRRLGRELLDAFFPPEFQDLLGALIKDGPTVAKTRIENYLADYAERILPADISKEEGPPAQASINTRVQAARRLFMILHTLQGEGRPGPYLDPWKNLPPNKAWEIPSGVDGVRSLPACPAHIERLAFQRLNARIAERLGVEPEDYEAEMRAMKAMSARQLKKSMIFLAVRDRQLLVLHGVLGARRGAVNRLDRGDVLEQHELPDGSIQPAIRLFEWKHRERNECAIKAIQPENYQCLASSMLFMDLYFTKVKGKPPLGPDSPLNLTYYGNRIDENYQSRVFTGKRPYGKSPSSAALLPREGRADYMGHGPQSMRSRTRQWIDGDTGRKWLGQHGVDAKPDWVAEATIGHKDKDLRKLYGGGSKTKDVEMLSAIGTRLTWLMLTTDLGARKTLDAEAYRDAVEAHKRAEAEKLRTEAELRRLIERRRKLRERLHAAIERKDEEASLKAERELLALDTTRDELEADFRTQTDNAANARVDMNLIRNDPRKLRVIPDDVPSNEVKLVEPEDLDEIERQVYEGKITSSERKRLAWVREYLSPSELAPIAGVTERKITNDLKNGISERAHGVPLWLEDDPLVDWATPKRRALDVNKLNPDHPIFTDPDKRLQLDEILATPYPEGWGHEFLSKTIEAQHKPKRAPAKKSRRRIKVSASLEKGD